VSERHRVGFFVSLAAILLVALGLRVFEAANDTSLPAKDAAEYDELAMSLLEGRGYRAPSGKLTAYRPPLYPLFLCAVYRVAGHDYQAVKLVQSFLSTVTVALVALWAWALFGRRAALWAALIAAVYTPAIHYYFGVTSILTETLYTFLLTGALTAWTVFFTRRPAMPVAVFSGLLWGGAVLARAVALPLLLVSPVLALVLRADRRSILRYHLVCWSVAAALLAPWVIRNARVFGAFVPSSTNGGASFYASNHAGSDGFGTAFYGHTVLPEDEALAARGLSEVERSSYFMRQGLVFFKEHPAEAARLVLWKAALYLDPTHTTVRDVNPRRVLNAYYVLAALGSALAVLFSLTDRAARRPILLLCGVFLFFCALHAVFHSCHRYRFPTEPMLIVLTAYTFERVRQFAERFRRRGEKEGAERVRLSG